MVIALALEVVMGIVAISTGATAIGLVCCFAMAICIWVFVVAEIVTFYRVGLPEPDDVPPGPVVGVRQAFEEIR